MTPFSDERDAEMRELFFETAQELLQSLNEEALKLERNPSDAELVRSIRRIVHTIKGDAAACGFRELSNAAHELEDALALESASSHGSLAEVAFAAADTFGAMLAAYRRKGKLPSSAPLAKMIRELAQPPKGKGRGKSTIRSKKAKSAKAAVAPAAWTEYEKLAIQHAVSRGKSVYHITTGIDPHCAMPIAARQLVLNGLATSAEVLGARPEAGSPASTQRLELLVASEKSADQLSALCRIPTVISSVVVELVKAAEPKARKAIPVEPAGNATSAVSPSHPTLSPEFVEELSSAGKPNHPVLAENILRVDAERIDSVLNLVGELIIGRSMLQQAFTEFARHVPKDALRGRFSDAMAFQSRVLSELQHSVMKIRMVPVEQLFRRFPRMVRDVAKQCGKEVGLVMSGQETDLDKSLLDVIAEPMTHLVRNAVSHGIESAEERVRNGKPARGTIHLTSYHHGNQVIVEITDDGAGIDVEKVKAKAMQKGLLTVEEADRLGETEILALVFRPGFSTADEITEVSGRGVGLDVVQTVLHRLKGSVEIETQAGRRTTFRLKLPLTLAIIKALLFRVEQRLYAVPLNAVAEIARARESDVHQVQNYEVLQLRDRVLPLVRLGCAPSPDEKAGSGKIFVLVIAMGERKLGLIVDRLEGEEELVIKALDDQTVATDLISGASILGDGRVVLIVNLPAIVDRHSKFRPEEGDGIVSGILLSHADRKTLRAAAGGGALMSPVRVLVVDDSALMRKLIPQILQTDSSIEVVGTAMDGNFGLRKIEELKPQVVTLDLEMPGMGGIDMLKEIMRRHRLPVIVVSSHSTEGASITLQALALGAFDFVAKPNDVSARMPQIAAELIGKIKAAAQSRGVTVRPVGFTQRSGKKTPLDAKKTPTKVIAIGVSTGGPQALQYVFSQLPADFPGAIVVVQHMPEGFTEMFARRLDEICAVAVKEAQSGDVLLAGRVLICPGSRHLKVKRLPLGDVAVLSDEPRVNGHRPSADVLFKSLADEFGSKGVAVLMTGMGDDGAQGMGAVKAAGGMTIAQSEESCVVYGMPKAAIDRGFAVRVVGLDVLANTLQAQAMADRRNGFGNEPGEGGKAAGVGRE